MTRDTARTLGALFSEPVGGQGGPSQPTPIFAGQAVREYEVTSRSRSDSALTPYPRLILAELAPGQAGDWSSRVGGDEKPWAGFEFVQIDATTEDHPLAFDHLYLVFSGPPDGVSPDEYDRFYEEHMRENLQMESFSEGWRWQSTPTRLDPGGQRLGPHLAIYRMEQGWADVVKDISSHTAVLSQSWPAWFKQIEFSSIEARATGAPLGAEG